MTPNTLARRLFTAHDNAKVHHLTPFNCKHALLVSELQEVLAGSGGVLTLAEKGKSLEGRSINLVSFGKGRKSVLLWSQMHGDESTATLALMDIFSFLSRHAAGEPWIGKMLGQLTVHVIPMLNPDGAERIQRRTAAQIDMNRDAQSLATPEARLLREMQRVLKPAFGFNLHDQEVSSVGTSTQVTALALLAPARDAAKSVPAVRRRAMRVGALIVRSLNQFAEGHFATYDDSYDPRAFGDSMQSWGTSTLLIESGHWPGDREKAFIRKLNFVAILGALRGISDGSYQDVELDQYLQLAQNGKRIYDLMIRNVRVEHPRGWSHRADIGIMIDPPYARQRGTRSVPVTVAIKEVGDLSTHAALETVEGHGRKLPAADLLLDTPISLTEIMDSLQLYHQPM